MAAPHSDPTEHVVKRVTPDSIIRLCRNACMYGGYADRHGGKVGDPLNVAVGPDGVVYIRVRTRYDHILTVTPDGMITAFAGQDNCGGALSPDGIAAQQACIFTNSTGLEIYPDGSLIVGDGRHRIRRIALPLAGFSVSSLVIPSPDGLELYEFDTLGRHLRTRDGLTGVTRYQFAYGAAGRFSDYRCQWPPHTIERTADGTPTAVVAPNGQRTTVTLGNDGYLGAIANPAGETTSLVYGPGGLLATLTDPRGGIHNFIYDGPGRLISDQGPSGEIKTLTARGASKPSQSQPA
jgi:YD repeat-containing protein